MNDNTSPGTGSRAPAAAPYLRLIDRDTAGCRCDVTPLFADPAAFAGLVDDLVGRLAGAAFDVVAAVDALGFVLGTAVAVRTGRGLVVVRKGGKLPVRADAAEFVDYTGRPKTLEVRPDAVPAGARVLVVDDWVETGAQVRAAISLVEGRGGVVAGVAAINIDAAAGAALAARGYPCFAVSDR
jgi:adenine phosphoribosyltransferase